MTTINIADTTPVPAEQIFFPKNSAEGE